MKKILLATYYILLINVCFSQYSYSLVQSSGNPGGLNTDDEQPFGAAGVTANDGYSEIIAAGQTTLQWSPVQTIPFPFNFNGNPVTSYKVSNSGVLTFDTAASTVPGFNNVSLPDSTVPDKSIMVWGLQQGAGASTNDAVLNKTHGTAPFQQHWVNFASFGSPGATGSQWTYWGIVLEETTNNLYVVDLRTYNTPLSLTIGIQINITTSIQITSAPNTPSLVTNGGSLSDPSDNVYYEFFIPVSCPRPSALTASNVGSDSADISWTAGGTETSWNIEYGTAGFTLGTGTNLNLTTNSYTMAGLNPSSDYEFYVKALCSTTDSSLFRGPLAISTTFVPPGCGDTFGPYCYGAGAFTVFTASASPGEFIDVSVSAGETEVGYDNLQFYDGVGNTGNLLYDADGDHTGASVLSTTGTITMYIEGDATENCDVPGTLPGPLTPIELSVTCITPFAIDVAGISMNTPSTLILTNGPFVISGELQNIGSNTVTSMDINYSIVGAAAVFTETVSGLSLSTGDNYTFNHGTTWAPNTGTYNIEIWATNINGSNDMNTSNDMASGTVTVFANGAVNRPMLESFTSSTCGPCAPGNVNVKGVLQGYQNNQYSILKYQVEFPGAGDPYYTAEVGDRRTYYNVTGVPDLVVDGNEWQGNSNSLISQTVDNSLAKLSLINLSANYSVWGGGQKVDFQVTIDPLADFTNLTLQAAIFEYETFNNTGTNGETEFEYVMKKMVPGSSGSNLNSLQDGVQRVENLSYTFNGNYILPPGANSPVNHAINHTVEDFDELGVIVWIQDDATKEILQSTTASLVTSVIENNSPASKLMIFPNPTSNLATIAFEGFENSDIEISLVNLLGEVVFSKKVNSSAYLNYYNLDVSLLSNGIYNVVAKSNGKITTKKLQILK